MDNESPISSDQSSDNLYQKISPPLDSNLFCWLSGGAILALNKIRHSIFGYTTPRTFSITEISRAINYDYSVISLWKHFLNEYCGEEYSLKNKSILELGPGADLGIGLILLSIGANKYNSLDINNLIETVPDEFYTGLFKTITNREDVVRTPEDIMHQLELTKSNNNGDLNYICDPTFDINCFKNDGIDLVLSNAAFEHFDDIDKTFTQLSSIVNPGCILLAEIDLSTHTRWIRDKDPLNIYRYSPLYYKMMKFSGSPNRIRPHQYAEFLDNNGWSNIKIIPYRILDKEYVSHVQQKLSSEFRSPENSMEALSIILCATR